MISAVSEMFQLRHFAQLSGIFGAAQCQGALAFCEEELDFKVGTLKHHRSTKLNPLLGRC